MNYKPCGNEEKWNLKLRVEIVHVDHIRVGTTTVPLYVYHGSTPIFSYRYNILLYTVNLTTLSIALL